jgi:hypothetical protein
MANQFIHIFLFKIEVWKSQRQDFIDQKHFPGKGFVGAKQSETAGRMNQMNYNIEFQCAGQLHTRNCHCLMEDQIASFCTLTRNKKYKHD